MEAGPSGRIQLCTHLPSFLHSIEQSPRWPVICPSRKTCGNQCNAVPRTAMYSPEYVSQLFASAIFGHSEIEGVSLRSQNTRGNCLYSSLCRPFDNSTRSAASRRPRGVVRENVLVKSRRGPRSDRVCVLDCLGRRL